MTIPTLQELSSELEAMAPNPSRQRTNRNSRIRTSAILVLCDAAVLLSILAFVVVVRSYYSIGVVHFSTFIPIAAIVVGGNALVSAWRGMYPGYGICVIAQMRSTFYSVTGVFFAAIAVTFFSMEWTPYARSIVLASYVVAVPTLSLLRMIVRKFLSRFPWYGNPVVVIGQHSMVTRIVDTLNNHKQIGLRPIAIIEPNPDSAEYGYHRGVPIIGGLDHISAIAERYDVEHGILALPHASAHMINEIVTKYCRRIAKVTLVGEHIHPSVLWVSSSSSDMMMTNEIEQRLREPSLLVKKRLFDLLVGIPATIIALPIMGITAVLALISSGRPLIYKQIRVGKNHKYFSVYKFRTMVANADTILADVLDSDEEARREWEQYRKLKKDPRITRIGLFLRRLSLDELPQLFNVLKGDMSLIGTRPYLVEERKLMKDTFSSAPIEVYDSLKPGISGLWQITIRSSGDVEDRINIDLYYMRNWSLFLDVYILIRTVGAVLSGRGAY